MRIPSGVTDQVLYFLAVDSTDLKTPETGLTGFTVYRARNGGTATAFTTPTTAEPDSANMPGVYTLLLDEDMTIDSGDDSQEMVFYITKTGVAPVLRSIELYRPKITAGNTLDVTATGAAGIDWNNIENPTTTQNLSGTSTKGLEPTTAGRTLDVTATGAAGIDWNNVENPTTTLALTNTSLTLTTGGLNAVADAVFDEDITTHRAVNSAGLMLQPMDSGNCQAGGSTTTIVLATTANAGDDYYNNCLIEIHVASDGTNKITRFIDDYVGATRTATVATMSVSPGATYRYVVKGFSAIAGVSAPTAADNAAAVWNAAMASYVANGSFGQGVGGPISHTGTCQAGGTTTAAVLASGANSTTNDVYKYQSFDVVAGTGAGQSSFITGYTASSRTATLNPALALATDNTSVYQVRKLGIDASTPAGVATAVWAATRAGNATAGTFGEYVNASADRIAASATAANNLKNMVDGTGLTLTNVVVPSVTTVTGNVNGNVGGNVAGSVASVTAGVTLADGAHGGSAATLTLKRAVVANTTNGQTAVDISASGTGNAHALNILATGGGKGVAIGAASNGLTIDSSAADAVVIQGGTDSDGLQISGNGTGVDIRANITGNIVGTLSQLTSAVADSVPADGTRPSIAQGIYMLVQFMLERAVSGTTVTVNKVDGTTGLFTLTLDDGTSPTSVSRAT